MNTTSTPTTTTTRKGSIFLTPTVCALVASGINLLLWSIGRVAGAAMVVDPALGEPSLKVDGPKVVVTTLIPFAIGTLLLALAARRSRSWVVAVAWVGAALAVASAIGPVAGGHDTTTGVLLATMHLTTGVAFVVAATKFNGRNEANGGGRP